MRILYCGDPLNYKQVDPDYAIEYSAAKKCGMDTGFINYEELVYMDDPVKAIKNIEKSKNREDAIFRGWMMTPSQYKGLYSALWDKNIKLINTPKEYKHCHYFPEVYPAIEGFTPKTVWLRKNEFDENMDKIWDLFKNFEGPVIIKDFVKSRKHEWEDACYIPDAEDTENVKRVVNNFIERQGLGLSEGIVIREYVELEQLTMHTKSNMPLSMEFRVFFLKGEPLSIMNYWEEGEYSNVKPDLEPLLSAGRNIKNNFFTMDIARKKDGDLIIVEVGDGQVSGISNDKDIEDFYKSLLPIDISPNYIK